MNAGREVERPRGEALIGETTGWTLFIGLLLTALGIIALVLTDAAGKLSVGILGVVLLVGGFADVVHGVQLRVGGQHVLYLLAGLLTAGVGALFLLRPHLGVAAIALAAALYFFFNGLFRGIIALTDRYPGWGWDLLYGCIAILLGRIAFVTWPRSSVWIVGTLVGIELLVRGVMMVGASLTLRRGARRMVAAPG